MPVITTDGSIADTGVAQESASHSLIESLGAQRDCYPLSLIGSFTLAMGWTSLYSGGTSGVFPAKDAVYWCQESWGHYNNTFDTWPNYQTPNNDTFGWPLFNPAPSPKLTSSSQFSWSAISNGTPYQLINGPFTFGGPPFVNPKGPSYGPLYAYCFNFGADCHLDFRDWFNAGTYTSTNLQVSDVSLLTIPQQGMNDDFSGSINIGGIIITFSMASGWSGAGITGNVSNGAAAPNRTWTANFSHTFLTRFKISMDMLNMGVYAGNSGRTGAGTVFCYMTRT